MKHVILVMNAPLPQKGRIHIGEAAVHVGDGDARAGILDGVETGYHFLFGLFAQRNVAQEEAHQGIGEFQQVHGDLRGEEGSVPADAVGLDQGKTLVLEIVPKGGEQRFLGPGQNIHHVHLQQFIPVVAQEVQRADVHIGDLSGKIRNQHPVINALQQVLVLRIHDLGGFLGADLDAGRGFDKRRGPVPLLHQVLERSRGNFNPHRAG